MPDALTRLNAALEGRYHIERQLGEGGMATVYLAADLKHERKVALKVLKPELAAVVGAERFLAEIKTTAKLQHPHILPLHDSGEADGFLYYVMPYVEGESLRDRIDRERQLPVDEAVAIATKVAGALAAAHERGVIHRDIKPANILLSKGEPLVSDFGIALAVSAGGGGRLTETGLSLGTPHYMSPEQATGDASVGPATDVYALGCVLYEMLVGEPPYTGSTPQAILGKIIQSEPVSATKARRSVPAHVDAVIRKALEKIPADRFTGAHALASALADPSFRHIDDRAPDVDQRGRPWKGIALVSTAVAVLALGLASWALIATPRTPVTRLVVSLGEGMGQVIRGNAEPPILDLTPDGTRLIYVGSPTGLYEDRTLFVRSLADLVARPLAGAEGGFGPAVSRDGSRVAFLRSAERGQSLHVVSIEGGTPITLVSADVVDSRPMWGPDDRIYYLGSGGDTGTRVMRVAPSGGASEVVLDPALGADYARLAHPVPVSERQLLLDATRGNGTREVHLFDLESGESTFSLRGHSATLTGNGYLLYVAPEGALMGLRFEPGDPAPGGEPAVLLQGVDSRLGGSDLAISSNGTLIYTGPRRGAPEQIVWVSPDGTTEPVDPDWTDSEFEGLALSPDGQRLAVEMDRDGRFDVWIKPVGEGGPSRLTFEGAGNGKPQWTPDGERIAYLSATDATAPGFANAVWARAADGTGRPELIFEYERGIEEFVWSPDGTWLVASLDEPYADVVAVRPGSGEEPRALLGSPANEGGGAISPDGRWLAYVSDETGRTEVYVVPFPETSTGKWQISTAGGEDPLWSRDGGRLFFRSSERLGFDVADMSRGPGRAAARPLFDLARDQFWEFGARMIDIAEDGRLLLVRAGQGDRAGDLIVVQGFFQELERLVRE